MAFEKLESDSSEEEDDNSTILVQVIEPVAERAVRENSSTSPSPAKIAPSSAKSNNAGKAPRKVGITKVSKPKVITRSRSTATTSRSTVRGKAGSVKVELGQRETPSPTISPSDGYIEHQKPQKVKFAVSSPAESTLRDARPTVPVPPTSRLKPAPEPYLDQAKTMPPQRIASSPASKSRSAMDEDSISPVEAAGNGKRKRSSSDDYVPDVKTQRTLRSTTRRTRAKYESDRRSGWGITATYRASSEVLESIEFDPFVDPLEHLKPPFYQHWDEKLGVVSIRGDGTPSLHSGVTSTLATPTIAATPAFSPVEAEAGGGKDDEILYFAYGIDMSSVYMEHRFPGAKVVGTGVLSGGDDGFRWCLGDKGYPLVYRCSPSEAEGSNGFERDYQKSEFQGQVHGVVFKIRGRKYEGVLDAECEMRGRCRIEQVRVDVKVRLENGDDVLLDAQVSSPADEHVGAIIEDGYGVRRQLKSDVRAWTIVGTENEQQEGLDTAAARQGAAEQYNYSQDRSSSEADLQDLTHSDIEKYIRTPMEMLNKEMNRAIFEALQEGMDREYVERVLRPVVPYPQESILHPSP